MSRVLVTGASGFLGGALLAELAETESIEVFATSRTHPARLAEGQTFLQADLADQNAVQDLLAEGPYDTVVHCAAFIGAGNTAGELENALATNVCATARLATALAEAGTRRLVFCSTTNIYGSVEKKGASASGIGESSPTNPQNAYAWSKLASELHLRLLAAQTGMEAVCLRLAGLHGPGRNTGVVHHMAKNALAGLPLAVREPQSAFTLLFAEDAAQALVLAMGMELSGNFSVFNVAGADAVTLSHLAEMIVENANSKSGIVLDDSPRARFQVFDATAFNAATGFSPAPVRQRLKESVRALERT